MRLILALALAVGVCAQNRESIEKQLKSVEQQRASLRQAGLSFDHADTPAGTAADTPAGTAAVCDPMPDEKISPLIESAARSQGLPAQLLRAVISQESGFRPCAVSGKGAQGLMQLMPATAGQLKVADPFDPEANIAAGAGFLRQLLEKYKGDLPEALGAYNAGSETVDKAAGVPNLAETRRYVDAIVEKMGIKHIDLPAIPPPKPIAAPKAIEAPKPVEPPKANEAPRPAVAPKDEAGKGNRTP